jgi:hypothetical protein
MFSVDIVNPNTIIFSVEFKPEQVGAETASSYLNAFMSAPGEKGAKIRVIADEIYDTLLPASERKEDKVYNVLYPTSYSTVRKSIEVGERVRKSGEGDAIKVTRNPIIGAVVIYEYLGLPEYLETLMRGLEEQIGDLCGKSIGAFSKGLMPKIIVGKELMPGAR